MQRYNPKEIEPRWQRIWDETGVYTADLASKKPKYIAMSMFNYPSGAGIHIGHAMNYTISDVKARFKRQQGYESYHPVGWDAFGLPAENYAIKAGVSPQESMATIIPGYHKQYKAMGWSNDWEKEIATHLPEYYKWTQWIFWKMHEQGLAYQDSRMQWWCTIDNTVLANEQVIDGKCWRHDGPDDPLVEKKEVKQWFFRITDYADELLDAIDELDWTESVKLAQKNWIGKSVGAEVDFEIADSQEKVTVFTTRPDTLFGATFMVLAPEHPLLEQITTSDRKDAVEAYREKAVKKSEVERQESKEKTGEFTGAYAINPVNGEKIPIWVADYVLYGYGTGAIMAVPAHDERDNAFARQHELPVKFVVEPTFGEAQGDDIQSEKVYVVLRNPAKDKVVVLDWGARQKNFGGSMLIGGTVEGEETHQQAAEREIREETGYKNFKLVKESEFKGHGYFYSNTKHGNYHASGKGLLYDLIDDQKDDHNLDEGEKDKFIVTWQPVAKVAAMLDDGVHEAMFRYLALDECYHGEGDLINSGEYDGMSTSEAREKIVADLEKQGKATEKTNYRMRDWSVGRQRYWGAPIPIINCPDHGPVLVPEDQLPVTLPELDDFKPTGDGRSALARATDWLKAPCPKCGKPGERETDTLDTYICSSWYMLRYFDPRNQQQAFSSDVANKWMPIDFYIGADHATAHMLYARFVTRFFTKIGLLDNPEPFKQFLFNGKVVNTDGSMFSKSKGVVVDPLDIIEQGYGADALRTYLMFAAPLDQWMRWDPQGVPGTHRFLSRVWTLVQEYLESEQKPADDATTKELRRATHAMAKKMTEDIEENRYNTAIAAAMTAVNELYKLKTKALARNDAWQQALEFVVACIAPFAPHIADELWLQLGHHTSVHKDTWPQFNDEYLATETITVAIQVNGKLRATLELPADVSEADATEAAQKDGRVAAHLEGKTVVRAIYVPRKLVNLVVK
jgi:leucyl-tRNA synthetase